MVRAVHNQTQDDVPSGLQCLTNELKNAARALANVDVSLVQSKDLLSLIETYSSVLSTLQAGRSRVQLQIERTSAYRDEGFKDTSSAVSSLSKTSRIEAEKELFFSKHLSELPSLSKAVSSGNVSKSQAEVIIKNTSDDEIAKHLVKYSENATFTELIREAQRLRPAIDELQDSKKRKALRECKYWPDPKTGMFCVFAKLEPQFGAVVKARLEYGARKILYEKRKTGTQDTFTQNMADAFLQFFSSSSSSETKIKNQAKILIDIRALRRGWRSSGETVEIDGVGPISVATAREMMGDAMFKLLVTDGRDVKSVSSKSRYWKSVAKEAIEFRDDKCRFPSCTTRVHLEKDHIQKYSEGGPTSYENARCLCSYHHGLVTRGEVRLDDNDKRQRDGPA